MQICPQNADNIHGIWIFPQNVDNINVQKYITQSK